MRIVFMGTPDFAKACLETLYTDGFDIAAVYTKIDTPKNRGMKLTFSPVKGYALTQDLPKQSHAKPCKGICFVAEYPRFSAGDDARRHGA